MPSIQNRFKLSSIYIAMLASSSFVVNAQQTDEKTTPKTKEEVEIIEVTGFKGSLRKSINDKRFSQNISDSIHAEDIGKSTDQNIADALSRVTGVSVQSNDGEGSTITVRGANSQQNNISLDGVQLGATDFSQSVDLSSFSSDILSKIEVVKTPSADHEEGSLGANINLVTVKPLDLTKNIRTLTLQGRYNDLSENEDYKISGSFSEKFLDETLGIFVTAVKETNSVRRDQYLAENWRARFSPIATNTAGEIVNDVWGLSPYDSKYELLQNDRDRTGINFGLQWTPTDDTDINLKLNWSKQDMASSLHGVKTRGSDFVNLVEGVDPGLFLGEAPYTDPEADWHTYDPETKTFTKWLNRFGLGDLSQSENEFENVNKIASLDITHNFSDSFSMSAGVGYSKAERLPGNEVYVNLQNFSNIGAWQLWHTPSDEFEPVGYDCTASGPCKLVGGRGVVDFGPVENFGDGDDSLWDNRSTTGFNPDDIAAQHLVGLNRSEVNVKDTVKSAHVDFDWDIEFGPVTSFEFGAKYTERSKFVDDQTTTFNSVGEGVVIVDPDTGNRSTLIGGLRDISASQFATNESFPVDNFMASLGYGRDNFTDGWSTFSAFQAFDLALGSPDVAIVPDNTETRSAVLDNLAVYFKSNFEALDGRLTGDIGVRYVKTEVEAEGYSGVNFHFDSSNLGRVFDPFTLQAYRDSSNPACPDINFHGNNWDEETRWARVDGLGYDTNGTDDKRDDIALPNAGLCYDANTERETATMWWVWRHADVSTEANYVYGDRQFDENGNLVATEDRSKRAFAVSGTHEYDVLLPSLNLNYAINDEMVGRLALSKTMSRPQIDSLRPGFKVTETVWGGNDRDNIITLTNPELDPLESKNLDISFEWYFDESGMFSAGLFFKDMTNFEESETIITYMDDLRGLGLDPNAPTYDVNNLLLIGGQDDLASCMPNRIGSDVDLAMDWVYSGDLEQMCARFKTTRIRNGKGASIKGLELGYTQTFDSLSGWMSGLGVQANYTYQDSEYDQEVSSIDENVTLPSLQVAYTPEHSYNVTTFWEQDGHQLRLSYQGTSDQVAERSWEQGTLWEEGRKTLDFSATYQATENISVTFQAVNLTDEGVRQYYTSRFTNLNGEIFDEGNAIDGEATKSRTVLNYRTGRTYRLSVRADF